MSLIESLKADIQAHLQDAESGHDWFHVERVWKNAKLIGSQEQVDMHVVELAALLHDIADWKFHNGDENIGPKTARLFLEKYAVEEDVILHVCEIILTMAYKGAGVSTTMRTKEGEVVQDADRLDAIGAIGIARTFSYGGHKNRLMYDSDHPPVLHQTKEAYINNVSPTINHFYEKLLLLKERMNTQTAKKIAQGRHEYMEGFLKQFFAEWNGEA